MVRFSVNTREVAWTRATARKPAEVPLRKITAMSTNVTLMIETARWTICDQYDMSMGRSVAVRQHRRSPVKPITRLSHFLTACMRSVALREKTRAVRGAKEYQIAKKRNLLADRMGPATCCSLRWLGVRGQFPHGPLEWSSDRRRSFCLSENRFRKAASSLVNRIRCKRGAGPHVSAKSVYKGDFAMKSIRLT